MYIYINTMPPDWPTNYRCNDGGVALYPMTSAKNNCNMHWISLLNMKFMQ